jgi:hypothetical protein
MGDLDGWAWMGESSRWIDLPDAMLHSIASGNLGFASSLCGTAFCFLFPVTLGGFFWGGGGTNPSKARSSEVGITGRALACGGCGCLLGLENVVPMAATYGPGHDSLSSLQ